MTIGVRSADAVLTLQSGHEQARGLAYLHLCPTHTFPTQAQQDETCFKCCNLSVFRKP